MAKSVNKKGNEDENPIKRIVFLLNKEEDDKDIWEFIQDRNFTSTIKKSLRLLKRFEDGEFEKDLSSSDSSANEELNEKMDILLSENKSQELSNKLDRVLKLLNDIEIKPKESVSEKKEESKLNSQESEAFNHLFTNAEV